MTSALERDEGSASRPGRILPPGKSRYPLDRRLGGPQGRERGVTEIKRDKNVYSYLNGTNRYKYKSMYRQAKGNDGHI